MKNIHILPTDKPSRVYYNVGGALLFTSYENHNGVNIYITNDEEIKEGDWIISDQSLLSPLYDAIGKVEIISLETKKIIQSDNSWYWTDLDCKKIILTTDQDLIADGVQPIDDKFLEWFVKNSSCESIEVRKLYKNGYGNWYKDDSWFIPSETKYKIIIPQEEPKQETLEDIANRKLMSNDWLNGAKFGAKWQQERSYSEDEIIILLNKFGSKVYGEYTRNQTMEDFTINWFEQFKKK